MSWICEAIGKEKFINEFETKEKACERLKEFVEQFTEYYRIIPKWVDLYSVSDNEFQYGSTEEYQACFVYQEPISIKDIMLIELMRAQYGLEQYQFELQDASTCEEHLEELRKMIEKI